ncbi:hypothetical protein [Marinobacter sp. NFXS9]|uniref:hypothetical protein n=1 Tax=Marinobacter sp. NFXS9 TaxID=2818433 RepID=UPI0032DF582A
MTKRSGAMGETLANTVLLSSFISFWIFYLSGLGFSPNFEMVNLTVFSEAASHLGREAGAAAFFSFVLSLVMSVIFGLVYNKDASHFENLSIGLGLAIGVAGIFLGYICLFFAVGQKGSVLFGSRDEVLMWELLLKKPIYFSAIISFFLTVGSWSLYVLLRMLRNKA